MVNDHLTLCSPFVVLHVVYLCASVCASKTQMSHLSCIYCMLLDSKSESALYTEMSGCHV